MLVLEDAVLLGLVQHFGSFARQAAVLQQLRHFDVVGVGVHGIGVVHDPVDHQRIVIIALILALETDQIVPVRESCWSAEPVRTAAADMARCRWRRWRIAA
jgi:hypothetical protein